MIVCVVGSEQVLGFELMIPGQVFGMANVALAEIGCEKPCYDVRICAENRAISTTTDWGAVDIRTPFGLEEVAEADVVIVPGTKNFLEPPAPAILEALRVAFDGGARIGAICVGAFILAATGLLDGRRVTTHWQWADHLARRHPKVDVTPAAMFVDDGRILTSAGVAAGLDLCLHLIRQDAGPELAGRTARRLVLPSWRAGGQAQYVESTVPQDDSLPLRATIRWMEENACEPLDLQGIARHASMSVRSLNRHFRDQLGTTPLTMLLQMRVDRARHLLESTTLPMNRVAEQSGFASHASLRYHFGRTVGVPPHKYRSSYVSDDAAVSRRRAGPF